MLIHMSWGVDYSTTRFAILGANAVVTALGAVIALFSGKGVRLALVTSCLITAAMWFMEDVINTAI